MTDDGRINPLWKKWLLDRRFTTPTDHTSNLDATRVVNNNYRLPRKTPGQLMYDAHTKEWEVVDETSSIGQIAQLRDEAKELLASNPTTQSIKDFEAKCRLQLVNIYNTFAGIRFNGSREVVDGRDFASVKIGYLVGMNLASMRSDLIKTSEQVRDGGRLFDRYISSDEKLHKALYTPSQADRFILTMLTELNEQGIKLDQLTNNKINNSELSQASQVFIKLLTDLSPSDSLIAIANHFYAGDMKKAFLNISAIAKFTKQSMPDSWRVFGGNTTEYRLINRYLRLGMIAGGIDGYVRAADQLYAGDMKKTFVNISAVANMCHLMMPDSWQQFQGNTTEFNNLKGLLEDNSVASGIEGYVRAADQLYAGDMAKTFVNISAVANMCHLTMPDSWQAFSGNTTEFNKLKGLLEDNSVASGIEGYVRAADDLYEGNMARTFVNISAVANMCHLMMPDSWQQFQGNTTEFNNLKGLLEDNSVASGIEGYVRAADDLYEGNMARTFVNISAVANMCHLMMPDSWQAFSGNTTEFNKLKGLLEDNSVASGIDGYLHAADQLYAGDMKKTFVNISAVANMCHLMMPDSWQQFQGNTTEFKDQFTWLQQLDRGLLSINNRDTLVSMACSKFSKYTTDRPYVAKRNLAVLILALK